MKHILQTAGAGALLLGSTLAAQAGTSSLLSIETQKAAGVTPYDVRILDTGEGAKLTGMVRKRRHAGWFHGHLQVRYLDASGTELHRQAAPIVTIQPSARHAHWARFRLDMDPPPAGTQRLHIQYHWGGNG